MCAHPITPSVRVTIEAPDGEHQHFSATGEIPDVLRQVEDRLESFWTRWRETHGAEHERLG